MEWKLPDKGETSAITLTFWFKNLAACLQTLDLDTVFWIPSSDWASETFLAQDWGCNKDTIATPWVASLKHGIPQC